MSESEAGTIARAFLQVWSAGHLDLLERLAHPDIVARYPHFPEAIRGRDAYRAMLEETFASFPDLRTTADRVVATGDEAAVVWHYEGTHQHGELFGVEPAGRHVRVDGMSMYRVADGRVVEERGVADIAGLMTQLGALR